MTVGAFAIAAQPVSVAQFAAFVAGTSYQTIAESAGSGFVTDDVGAHGIDSELIEGASWRRPTGPDGPPAVDESPVTQIAWFDALAWCAWSQTRLATEAEWEVAARIAVDRGATTGHEETTVPEEWTADWFDATFHQDEQRVNPTGPTSGTSRVVRTRGRVTARVGRLPDWSANNLGFRPVRISR